MLCIFYAKKARKNGILRGTPGFMPTKLGKSKGYDKQEVSPKYKAMRESLSVMATSITYQR